MRDAVALLLSSLGWVRIEELLGQGGVYHDLYMNQIRREVETAPVPQGAGVMVAAK